MTIVVWDLGGVAARFVPERRTARLAKLTGLDGGVIVERIWGSGLDDQASRGSLSREETYDAVLAALVHRVDRPTVRAAWALAFEPVPTVLAQGGAVLTNNGPILEDCLDHELAELRRAFSPVLLSWRLAAMKPEREAFTRAATALGVRPGELELVDDEPANVAAAIAAGWRARVFS